MLSKLLGFLFILPLLATTQIRAEDTPPPEICSKGYARVAKKVWSSLQRGYAKLAPTYGFRLILTPETPNSSISVWHGFGRIQGPVQSWALPFYPIAYPIRTVSALIHMMNGSFTPNFTYPSLVRGVLKNTYFLLVREITSPIRETLLEHLGPEIDPELKTYLSQNLKPSGWVDFALAFVGFNYAYAKLISWYNEFAVKKQKEWIQDSSDRWTSLLKTDPYYSRIAALESELNKKDLVQEIFIRASSLDLLYLLIDDQKKENLSISQSLLSDPEFKETFKPVLPATLYLTEHSPEAGENFLIPEEELHPATSEQLKALIEVNLRFLKRRSLVRAFFEKADLFELLSKKESYLGLAREMQNDPQIQFYLREFEEGKIDSVRARYLVLEWALIKERFERWSIFKAQRIIGKDGENKHGIAENEVFSWRQNDLQNNLPFDFANTDIYPSLKIESRSLLDKPLNSYLTKLVFLRSVEPSMRGIWRGLERTVGFMGSGSARTGIAGERVSVAANAGAQIDQVQFVGTGNFARGLAIFSSIIVYADIAIHWHQLKHIKGFVDKTDREVLYLED